jgi:hypothetical protein
MEGMKNDETKPRFDLLDGEFIFEVATVMTFGAKKYADRNYMQLKWTRVFSACMRHLWKWFLGEKADNETGKSHLVHAGCCCMMLYEMRKSKKNDDRPILNTVSAYPERKETIENGSDKANIYTG